MCIPKDSLVNEFHKRIKSISVFFEKNFHERDIVSKAALKYRLQRSFPACSLAHSNRLLSFFARMLLRVFCKKSNEKLKKNVSRNMRKFAKLNV